MKSISREILKETIKDVNELLDKLDNPFVYLSTTNREKLEGIKDKLEQIEEIEDTMDKI